MKNKMVSNRLVTKLSITFLLIIVLAGASYIAITIFIYNRYFEETTQKLNADVAQHLIAEKFQRESPFLEDGSVNKPLFGDIMHDMMSVNQGIEVYLLDKTGLVLYSVVLDHDSPDARVAKVDMAPILKFLASERTGYILGDDPRNPEKKKIFSAAPFEVNGREGYIYIILAGQEFENTMDSLWSSYFLRLGVVASLLTIAFASILGIFAVWYITRNLREIIFVSNRFKEGDLKVRIQNAEKTDLAMVSTTFNEMADTIVENIEKLQSVETLRRELIANVSHDLRTPLSILQGYVETLRMKTDSLDVAERDRYLEIVQNSSTRLSQLISQLFEYSKLEANQVEPKKEPFQITELVSDIHANYQVIAEQKKIDLKLDIPGEVPLVFADIGLVERAIQNLLDNAMKFTDNEGNVNIQVRTLQEKVEISIKDSGPGIPQEEQSVIFERYKQSTATKQKSGSGLGLAIVKKILEIHDSTIKVISRPNEGTIFRFSLPAFNG